jgi:phosphoserine aminotransferase
MARIYNFSAGPAIIPEEVLKIAQAELLDYNGTGMSVMEMSHRSDVYQEIFHRAMRNLRTLMNIPENYKILFLQGGASSQFAMVPLNLLGANGPKDSLRRQADYINTGVWSKKAIAEAKRYGDINVVASSEDENFNYVPLLTNDMFNPNASYVHYTTNNTIYGTLFSEIPDVGDVPLVADMSSNILSQEYDVSKFGLIYAGAQKNMGPSGLTVVIVREDLVGNALEITPKMFNYETHVKANSMFNTPPCYGIYIAGLIYEWMIQKGGVRKMEETNRQKANLFYNFLDSSVLFKATVRREDRSIMNIPFITGNDEMDAQFIKSSESDGFLNLKGHRLVGGMRASIYNAMSIQGVEALVDYMQQFEKNNL